MIFVASFMEILINTDIVSKLISMSSLLIGIHNAYEMSGVLNVSAKVLYMDCKLYTTWLRT